MFVFLISVSLAITTIFLLLRLFKIDTQTKFFSFFPLLFLYIESISFVLSIGNQLVGFWMLFLQGILCFGICLYSFHHLPIQTRKAHYTVLDKPTLLLIAGIGCCFCFLILSAILRFYTPTQSFDDVSYRAAAPMHWLQAKNVYRTASLSEHGNVFLYGTGIYYLWPFLFTSHETVATLFYWLAFPILCLQIYFFTKHLIKRQSAILCALLLFITAPILYRHVSLILIQELWLSVVLVSCIYLLYTALTKHQKNPLVFVLIGSSFGLLPQLKPTGWFYTLFLLLFLLKQYRKQYLSVIFGFFLSLTLSGYFIILYQNYLLYGSFGGTHDFTSLHLASFSFHQLVVHLLRIPFLFIKIPCYTTACHGLDTVFQPLSTFVGATKLLPYELSEGWIGTFQYLSSDPDRNFGFGGIIWFFLLCISLWFFYALVKQKTTDTQIVKKQIIMLFSGIIFLMLFVIRWEDASGVPYKHLISPFALACIFGMSVIKWKHDLSYYLLSVVMLCCSFPLIQQTMYTIQLWKTGQIHEVEQELRLTPSPYAAFLETLSTPTTFLILEHTGIPHYSLYFLNKEKVNSLSFFIPPTPLHVDQYAQSITHMMDENAITYVITPDDKVLIASLSRLPVFTYITAISFEDAKTHIFRYNKN